MIPPLPRELVRVGGSRPLWCVRRERHAASGEERSEGRCWGMCGWLGERPLLPQMDSSLLAGWLAGDDGDRTVSHRFLRVRLGSRRAES